MNAKSTASPELWFDCPPLALVLLLIHCETSGLQHRNQQKWQDFTVILESVTYQDAHSTFAAQNVTENYGELANAKGNYLI